MSLTEFLFTGEGSGILVLEELEHARRRNARIYAELRGWGSTGDAHHITAPAVDGEGAARAMLAALARGGLSSQQVCVFDQHECTYCTSYVGSS